MNTNALSTTLSIEGEVIAKVGLATLRSSYQSFSASLDLAILCRCTGEEKGITLAEVADMSKPREVCERARCLGILGQGR